MSDVFLSYAHQDRAVAKDFAEWLSDQGHSVFWDRQIVPGTTWDVMLERELKVARCVVVLWTRHSVNSQWVKTEAGEAAERAVLVPVLLEEVELPLRFKSLQTANLSGWEGSADDSEARNLLAAVRALTVATEDQSIGGPRPASSPPPEPDRPGSVPNPGWRFRWTLLGSRQGRWLGAAQLGALSLGFLLALLLPPPVGIQLGGERVWLRLGLCAISVLPGAVMLAAPRWGDRRHAMPWWGASGVAMVAAAVVFFQYQRLAYQWTGEYDGRLLVVGSVYTEHGKSYVEKNPDLPLTTLLDDFLGRPEDIWTRASINRRRQILAGLYVSCLPLFLFSAMALVQALRCRLAPRLADRGVSPQNNT